MKALVTRNKDLNTQDVHGQTALDKAILGNTLAAPSQHSLTRTLSLLSGLLGGARNPLSADVPAMSAEERERRRNVIQYLIGHGADVNSTDTQGTTPLMLTAIFDPDENNYEEIGK